MAFSEVRLQRASASVKSTVEKHVADRVRLCAERPLCKSEYDTGRLPATADGSERREGESEWRIISLELESRRVARTPRRADARVEDHARPSSDVEEADRSFRRLCSVEYLEESTAYRA